MIVREPLVQATYYYLYEAPGDTSDRREDRYRQFVEDTQRMLASVAGWLAMPAPEMPRLAAVNSPPRTLRPLMELAELRGHTNAAAWLQAYALRNMLLLRVVLARPGDHEHTVWRTLDESLGEAPTTPTWLATTRYWCGMAPRLPEDLDPAQAELVRALVRKARLPLDERQMAIVLEAAPYVLAMADRVRRCHDRALEPCNAFRFPGAAG